MLAVACAISLAVALLLLRKWRARQLYLRLDAARQWVREQRSVADFSFAGDIRVDGRLHLRAEPNSRLKAALGIHNSLTTASLPEHKAFFKTAMGILKRGDRSWVTLYRVAEHFLQREIQHAAADDSRPLRLAECIRCFCLAVVLFDNFGTNPADIPREHLATITGEINTQWLRSKCDPAVARSALLDKTIAALNLQAPHDPNTRMGPSQALSLIMPQYETLWRVVLLTFITAYHLQPAAHADAVHRTADEGLRLYPSNKTLYRSHPSPASTSTTTPPAQCSITALHRHPAIWGPDALAFRPARFDRLLLVDYPSRTGDGPDDAQLQLQLLQRAAYIPYSVAPHRCPAGGDGGFGNRMVTCLCFGFG
ncbi:hypothetical protein BT67DRAFT_435106 [Trichocladium antarcticum]|uniref:Cytochrome P450 n=1 Tax=Trichocladium antarcticum TaxID=1450529 RepID=A0AAN6ZCH9_9PEZI|nr:hypothetical protein BT67DRAFT_435106 [Trichocladium antarcticum]